MATARRRTRTSLIDQLFRSPRGFDFFQAVRALDWTARRQGRARLDEAVGESPDPGLRVVRFRAQPSVAFPASALTDARPGDGGGEGEPARPPELTVAFLGLIGPSGMLPQHYTETMIRSLRAKSTALRDFFDVFHHRSLTLFYRAWAKYRLPVLFERTPPGQTDPVTGVISSLVGLNNDSLRDRLPFPDVVVLHYAGLLSHRPRSAVGLQAILSDFFGRPVEVAQFQGNWLCPTPDQRTRLPSADQPDGQYCQLGIDAVVGDRVWDVAGSFRIRLGPLSYDQFLEFMPGGPSMRRLEDLVRLYAGLEHDFDVQVSLACAEVPQCRLWDDQRAGPRLGRNTWLLADMALSDRDDAVFPAGELAR